MKKFAIFLLLMPMTVFARFSAKDALLSAPDAIIGYIDNTNRLDMIDYLEAGQKDHTVSNRRGGRSSLQQLSDSTFVIKNGEVQTISARLLPVKSDTLIAIIETLATPTPDSRLTIYNKEWKPIKKSWSEPAAKDWGKTEAKFLLTEYSLSADTLTLTDRTAEWMEPGTPVKRLQYVWNPKSKKFSRLK